VDTSPVQEHSTPTIGCDCIEKANRPDSALTRNNTELGITFHVNRETGAVSEKVAIVTSVLVKKRGARPIRLIPNYCPMCGTRYPSTDAASRPPAAEEQAP
jgi:hypothetical protein